jgi:hypothetical protein
VKIVSQDPAYDNNLARAQINKNREAFFRGRAHQRMVLMTPLFHSDMRLISNRIGGVFMGFFASP